MNGFDGVDLSLVVTYLATLATLAALFYGEVKLIQGTVQIVKVFFSLEGRAVVGVSFLIGILFGGLLYGLAWDSLAEFPIHVRVILGVMYLLMSGLLASGFYELRDAVMIRRSSEKAESDKCEC